MRHFGATIFLAVTLGYSSLSFTHPYEVPPKGVLYSPRTCTSEEQGWRVEVIVNKGRIYIYDQAKDELLYELSELDNRSTDSMIKLHNYRFNNDQPQGIIFEVQVDKSGQNAYVIEPFSWKRVELSCSEAP